MGSQKAGIVAPGREDLNGLTVKVDPACREKAATGPDTAEASRRGRSWQTCTRAEVSSQGFRVPVKRCGFELHRLGMLVLQLLPVPARRESDEHRSSSASLGILRCQAPKPKEALGPWKMAMASTLPALSLAAGQPQWHRGFARRPSTPPEWWTALAQ